MRTTATAADSRGTVPVPAGVCIAPGSEQVAFVTEAQLGHAAAHADSRGFKSIQIPERLLTQTWSARTDMASSEAQFIFSSEQQLLIPRPCVTECSETGFLLNFVSEQELIHFAACGDSAGRHQALAPEQQLPVDSSAADTKRCFILIPSVFLQTATFADSGIQPIKRLLQVTPVPVGLILPAPPAARAPPR